MDRNTIQQCTQNKQIAYICVAVYEKSTLSILIEMRVTNLVAYSASQVAKPSDQHYIYYLLIAFELTQVISDYYFSLPKIQLFMPVLPINNVNTLIQKQKHLYLFASSEKFGYLSLTKFSYGFDVVGLKSLTNYKKMIDTILVSNVDVLSTNYQPLESAFTCCSIHHYIIVQDRLGGNFIKKEVNIARPLTKLRIA